MFFKCFSSWSITLPLLRFLHDLKKVNCLKKLMKHFFFKILRRIQWYKSLFIICLDLKVRTIPSLRSKWSLETPFTKYTVCGENRASVSRTKNSEVDPSKNINLSTKYFKNLINAYHIIF